MLIYLDIETTRFFQDAEIARLPRAKDADQELYRYWISADGAAWRLADSSGRTIDIEGWGE